MTDRVQLSVRPMQVFMESSTKRREERQVFLEHPTDVLDEGFPDSMKNLEDHLLLRLLFESVVSKLSFWSRSFTANYIPSLTLVLPRLFHISWELNWTAPKLRIGDAMMSW